jgi:hypothetical protein
MSHTFRFWFSSSGAFRIAQHVHVVPKSACIHAPLARW